MKFKRNVSAVLAVIMALSCFGTGTFAEEAGSASEDLIISDDSATSDSAVSLGYSFGSEGVILKPGTYSIGVSLKNAENTEKASMAASCIKKAKLTVDEEGNAGLKINLRSLTVDGVTGTASQWKIYQNASASGEAVLAEETADSDGNITAIEFTLPNSGFDGVYVNMYIDAMEAEADAYIEIDYSSAAADGKYTADLNLTHEDTDEVSAAADYFTTKAADIIVSDSSIYVKLAYTDSAVGDILQAGDGGEYSVLTASHEEDLSFVTAELDNIKAGAYLQISINSEEAAVISEEEAEAANEANTGAYYTVKLTVDTDTLTETAAADEEEDETESQTETEEETETESETQADEDETSTEASTETTTEETETTTEETETTTKKKSSSSSSSSSSGGGSYYVGSSSSSSSSGANYSTAMAAGVVRVTIGSSSVVIDGKRSAMEAAAYIQEESSSTLVPLRFVALAILGGTVDDADESEIVEWNSSKKTATIYAGDDVISFTAGSNIMVVNGEEKEMSYGVKAEITDSRMYIPFRALGEALGVEVEWEAASKTAIYRNN
ncbi:MAG: NEAT domain-containing protein [Clostridiales bacterium]|nr:NEAT domain-containing protein [Clostridiales bacterium]